MAVLIRMGQRSDGTDTAEVEWEGKTLRLSSRHGATMRLARVLVDNGMPDQPWEGVDAKTGRPRLSGPSLHRLALLAVQDGDSEAGVP